MMNSRFLQLRLISLVAVFSLFFGSALMFAVGFCKTIGAFLILFPGIAEKLPYHLSESALISVALIQAVDAFLFALVLLIFSYGIYILFVHTEAPEELSHLPPWMQVQSIGELKTTLFQIIIVILAVNVLEYVIMVGPEALKWESLIIPVTIFCLAAALRLMHLPRE